MNIDEFRQITNAFNSLDEASSKRAKRKRKEKARAKKEKKRKRLIHKKSLDRSSYGEREGNPWHSKSGEFASKSDAKSFSLRGVKKLPKAGAKMGKKGSTRMGDAPADCGRDARGHAVGYKHGTARAAEPVRVAKYKADLRCYDKKLKSPDPKTAKERGIDMSKAAQAKRLKQQQRTVAKLGQAAARGQRIKAVHSKGKKLSDKWKPDEKVTREKVKEKGPKYIRIGARTFDHAIGVAPNVDDERRREIDVERAKKRFVGPERKRKIADIKRSMPKRDDEPYRKKAIKTAKIKIRSQKGRHKGLLKKAKENPEEFRQELMMRRKPRRKKK